MFPGKAESNMENYGHDFIRDIIPEAGVKAKGQWGRNDSKKQKQKQKTVRYWGSHPEVFCIKQKILLNLTVSASKWNALTFL